MRGGFSMAKVAATGLILLLACSSWGQPASSLLLKNVNIVALGGGVDEIGREVLMEDGKIVSIRPARDKPVAGVEQVEASGKWLIPGLIDLGVHLANADSGAMPQDLAEFLAGGVTSILEVSGASADALRERSQSDHFAVPRVFFGCMLLPSAATNSHSAPGSFSIKNEEDARQAMRAAKAQAAQVVYLDPRLESNLVKAALQEAQAINLPTAGVALGYSFEDAARGGINWLYDVNSLVSASIGGSERRKLAQAWASSPAALYGTKTETLFFEAWDKIDPAKEARKELVLLANRAVFVAPLLALEEKRLQELAHTAHGANVQNVKEKFRALLRLAFELQVPLLMGSGYSRRDDWRPTIHDEMEAWINAGLAPRFVLEAATINAGHALRQHDLGQIGEGMRADLVLLDEHPYQNFGTLRRPWLVIQNGRAHARAVLARWQDPPQRAERELRAVLQWQEQAWNDGDIERFMRGYWKSDSTIFASSTISRGWQAMLERYQRSYPTPEKMGKLKFTITQIDMINSSWAKVLGAWELSGLPENPRGWFTLIMRRSDEGWRIVHDHTSTAPATR
jgi:ketosteroid isomerase-like protein